MTKIFDDIPNVIARYYSAPWCQPCKQFKPIATQKIVDAGFGFSEINVDENQDAAAFDNVMSLPTIVFTGVRPFMSFHEEFARVVGASNKQLDEALKKAQEYIEK